MHYPQLANCNICPRYCGIDRYSTTGFCGAGSRLKINLAALHHGEEPPISGSRGSGTIFFSWCNLHCVFCQNHRISNDGWGNELSETELSDIMLRLADEGAHNINLVTPTHFSPLIATAIQTAKYRGLCIPIVWNSSAYECEATLESMNGLIDIYLPDYKYAHGIYAKKYSAAPDYPEVAMKAIETMYAQCGDIKLDSNGIAKRGTIVRLLVLPNGLSGTKAALIKLAERLGTDVSISLMAQYYPTANAEQYLELSRGISEQEYMQAVDTALELGFANLYTQELSCSDMWTPTFQSEGKPVEKIMQVKPACGE
jgi:putative pyruvate formate lyase activating enzyme